MGCVPSKSKSGAPAPSPGPFTHARWREAVRASSGDVQATSPLLCLYRRGTPHAQYWTLDVLHPDAPGAQPELRFVCRGHTTKGPGVVESWLVFNVTVLGDAEALLILRNPAADVWARLRLTRLSNGCLMSSWGGSSTSMSTILTVEERYVSPPFEPCGVPAFDSLAGILAPPPSA
jgi:hypothetical protein